VNGSSEIVRDDQKGEQKQSKILRLRLRNKNHRRKMVLWRLSTDTLSRTLKTLGALRNDITHEERNRVVYEWFVSLVENEKDQEAVIKT
jgi:hypothetical protein